MQFNRASLIQMTPRGHDLNELGGGDDGLESFRSSNLRLTGIKPKALQFFSPSKSPIKSPIKLRHIGSESTKDGTASGARDHNQVVTAFNHNESSHQQFGISNCIFKCDTNE
jgi:hypothetical protein